MSSRRDKAYPRYRDAKKTLLDWLRKQGEWRDVFRIDRRAEGARKPTEPRETSETVEDKPDSGQPRPYAAGRLM